MGAGRALGSLVVAAAITVLSGCSSGTSGRMDHARVATEPVVSRRDTPVHPSAGCGAPDAAFVATTDGIIRSGGVDRQYKLVGPAGRSRR